MSWRDNTLYSEHGYQWRPGKPSPDAATQLPYNYNMVDCKFFGCIGDGAADDTHALQRAIKQASKQGKVLYLSPGTYLVTSRLDIADTVTIVGGHRSASKILYKGAFHTESAYDEKFWTESNAAILIRANYWSLSNFTLEAADDGVLSNGIAFHYPNPVLNNYSSSEGCTVDALDIRRFKNGIFTYAGWTRTFSHCRVYDSVNYGIKWEPLEVSTVGHWSGSGDIMTACQFIGNDLAGVYAKDLFEFTAWNCVFEYNGRPIITDGCDNVTFKNCWSEANYGNSQISGSARFEGGYNFNPSTVDHTPVAAGDVVTFVEKAATYVVSGSAVVFKQESGIITQGVNLAVEVDNMFTNPDFSTSGTPDETGWDKYVAPSVHETEKLDDEYHAVYFNVSGLAADDGYGIRQVIPVVSGKSYNITVFVKSPDRTTIDSGGLLLYVQHRNGAGEPSWNDNRSLGTLAANNVWEQKSAVVAATGDDAYLYVGFGCARNGQAYFARPEMCRTDAVSANNVFVRVLDSTHLTVVNMAGQTLGTLTVTPV